MPSATDKLTIELPWREALSAYSKRLLYVLYAAAANVVLLLLVVVLSVTVGLSVVAAALSAIAVTIGSIGIGVATSVGVFVAGAIVGVAAWLFKHWLLSIAVVLLILFAIAALGDKSRR
jgi:hypothetical protein